LHPPIFEGSATLPQTRLGLQFGGRQSHKGSSNGGTLLKYRELINAFIGLVEGNFAGQPHISKKQWFPVDFPLNQSNDTSKRNNTRSKFDHYGI